MFKNNCISIKEAILTKYCADIKELTSNELYIIAESGSRKFRLPVEFVGQEKIHKRQSQLDLLYHAILHKCKVDNIGIPGDIANLCPNIKVLDLSNNFLNSWKDISELSSQLPHLTELNLSNNKLDHTTFQPIDFKTCFQNLHILFLNNVSHAWSCVVSLIKSECIPHIQEIHLSYNQITILENDNLLTKNLNETDKWKCFKGLKNIDFSNNNISNWDEIYKLRYIETLEDLNLNSNVINDIYYQPLNINKTHNSNTNTTKTKNLNQTKNMDIIPFKNLSSLKLSNNNVKDWSSINSLNLFPKLSIIEFSHNPIHEIEGDSAARMLTIARIANLTIINRGIISKRQRIDSEKFYLSRYEKDLRNHTNNISLLYPRFQELNILHYNNKSDPINTNKTFEYSNTIETIDLSLKSIDPSSCFKPSSTRKLPVNITIDKIKLIFKQLYNTPPNKQKIFYQDSGMSFPFELVPDTKDLGFFGLSNGGSLMMQNSDI